MTKSNNVLGLAPFDAADNLADDATIAEFLDAALEDGRPDIFLQAIRTAAHAACPNWRVMPGWAARVCTRRWHPVRSHVLTRS